MKPRWFFLGLSLLVLLTACTIENEESRSSAAQGDWAALSLEELKEGADLIAFVEVKSKEAMEKSNGLNAQLSTLKVLELISGTAQEQIELDQATEFVKQGESYLLFLTDSETQGSYHILNPAGIIQEKDGVYETGLVEGDGAYSREEVRKLLFN